MIDTASRNGRSETEIIGRSGIAVAMGDATYWLRPLTMDQAEEWERQIVALIGTSLTSLGGLSGIDGLLGIMRQGVDAMLDALYKYDELGSETPALPDRFILRKQASRDDLYQALRKLVKHEFPPLTSAEEWHRLFWEHAKCVLPESFADGPINCGGATMQLIVRSLKVLSPSPPRGSAVQAGPEIDVPKTRIG